MNNYLITYSVKDKKGRYIIGNKQYKVKRKINELEAKIKFEMFLKRKYPNFGVLIIHNCKTDIDFGIDDINDFFGGIFK